MSWEAVKHVMDNSGSVGTDRLVLLALAESADKLTWETWIGHETIGRKAGGVKGIHERTVQRSLKKLATMGELKIIEHGAPQPDRKFQWRSNLYRIVRSFPAAVSSSGDTPATTTKGLVVTSGASSGDTGGHLVVTPAPPKPEVKPSKEPETTTTGSSLSILDEIEAGIALAVKRIADDQESGTGFTKTRRAFEAGTEKIIRADRDGHIACAFREGWSSERLADELAPRHVESVAVGAAKTPDVTYCDEHGCYLAECPAKSGHRWVRGKGYEGWRLYDPDRDTAGRNCNYGPCWCEGKNPDCMYCGGDGLMFKP